MEWVSSGWWIFYYIKAVFAETAGDLELAKHYEKLASGPRNIDMFALSGIFDQISNYESLHAHETPKPIRKWEELLMPHRQPQNRLRRRAMAYVAGLRMSDYELLCAMEYIAGSDPYFLDGTCQKLAQTWNRRAIELIEGSEQERPLGFMMIELPQNELSAKRKHGWVCHCCFRHSKERTKFCKKHSPSKNPAGWKDYVRGLERYYSKNFPETTRNAYEHFRVSNDYFRSPTNNRTQDFVEMKIDRLTWGIGEYSTEKQPSDWNKRVTKLADIHDWLWDVGLHNPQPPFDWKVRIAKWKVTYPWLPALLFKGTTWADVVTVLRTVLEDDHCFKNDFDLWETKVQAKNLEREWQDTLRSAPKKRRPRSSITCRVALLARNPSMTQKKIAERLKISRARVSQIVDDDPRLQHLRRKTVRKSCVTPVPP